ncbi:hypothetical protein FNB79_02085 [Formosa sediminum]|uniref:Uncharacterized protein n=1 Tax=Formosa sediminum TaxID=2594004 RepID=A0A516GMR2_9FLAO|nr:hypothetical protein [Formosa sediminum]QDO92814.1 hypothetical protein FNB79_02085 [Formosa sediminum]
MVSNNFENNIKESLEKRRIQPSVQAWQQLDSKLKTQEHKRAFKPYWFVAIAASFVGVALLSTWVFTTKNTKSELPVVEVELPLKENNPVNDSSNSFKDDVVISKIEEKGVTKNHQPAPKTKKGTAYFLKQHTPISNKTQKTEDLIVEELASNSEVIPQNITVSTEDYIEDLLKEAEAQITLDQALNDKQHTVDSEALLEGVENEIEHSFREKVFDAVKSGFKKVKTAVVERND